MGRRNPLEGMFDRIEADFASRRVKAKKANAVPLGMEELAPREARTRFANMSPEERQRLMDTLGQAEVLKMVRGGQ